MNIIPPENTPPTKVPLEQIEDALCINKRSSSAEQVTVEEKLSSTDSFEQSAKLRLCSFHHLSIAFLLLMGLIGAVAFFLKSHKHKRNKIVSGCLFRFSFDITARSHP